MIHCDEERCVAPTDYAEVKLEAPYVDPKTGVEFKAGQKVVLPMRPAVGPPDHGLFLVDDLWYCGWHVDGASTRHAARLGLDQAFAARVEADGYTVSQAGSIVVRAGRGRHEGWALVHPHRPNSQEPERPDPWNDAEHAEHLARLAHEVSNPTYGVHTTSVVNLGVRKAHEKRQAEAKR